MRKNRLVGGTSFHKRFGKFLAYIRYGNISVCQISLGYYDTEFEAKIRVERAMKALEYKGVRDAKTD